MAQLGEETNQIRQSEGQKPLLINYVRFVYKVRPRAMIETIYFRV